MSTSLVLAKDYDDMATKYNLFTNQKASAFIQDEEAYYQEKNAKNVETQQIAFAEMFGSSVSAMEDLFEETIAEKVVETETLQAEKDDPFQQKVFEERKVVFTASPVRERAREAEVVNKRSTNTSTTNASYNNTSNTVFDVQSNRGTSSTTYGSTNSYAANGSQKEPPSIFEHVMRISKNVENVAYRTKSFEDNRSMKTWGARKPSLWERCKAFFSSPKFRIMAKLGAMLSLQLFMAKLAGKYEIKNGAQFIGVIGLMLGTFYMSKELQAEGFDMRGFDI